MSLFKRPVTDSELVRLTFEFCRFASSKLEPTVRKFQQWTLQYTTHAIGNGKKDVVRGDNGRGKKGITVTLDDTVSDEKFAPY